MLLFTRFFLVASATLFAVCAHAATIIATPADYTSKIPTLTPGDILEMQAGRYTSGLPVYNLNGTDAQRITIRGPATGARAVLEGSDTNNVIRVRNSSFVTIQNLEVDGIVGGVPREGFGLSNEGSSTCSHDMVVENLYIHDLVSVTPPVNEGDRQIVGIALNSCTAWNWTLRGNRFERVGLGMYLGSPTGNQPFFSGVIEYNTFIDTIGYNIEIKHQNVRPVIAGMPTTDSRIVIRHNVFSKNSASSAVDNARPNLLVGHMPPSGPGLNDRFEIYGNFFFQNSTEVLFQGSGNIYFYDNVMFNSQGSAIVIQTHEGGSPRDVHVFNNTIVATGNGISLSGGMGGFVQEVFGNAIFAGTPISGGSQRDNITGTFAAAATHLNNPSATIAQLDLFPRSTSLTGTAVSYASVANPVGSTLGALTEYANDFNGALNSGAARGAYVYAGSSINPGWKLALSPKPVGVTPPPPPPPPPPSAPTVSLSATPTLVALNGSSQLNWSSSNADSCAATGGWSGTKSTQGTQAVGPLTASATYVLTCTNSSGSAASQVTVNILPAPTITLSANPTTVTSGSPTTLSWSTSNATTCTASGAWAGNKALGPASEQSPVLTVNGDFVLSCQGSGGSLSRTVSVAVTAAPPPPPPPPTPTPTPTPTPAPATEGDSGGGALSLGLLLLCGVLGLMRRRSLHV